jgi:hypothetical protein
LPEYQPEPDRWRDMGLIPFYKIEGRAHYDLDEVMASFAKHRMQGKEVAR